MSEGEQRAKRCPRSSAGLRKVTHRRTVRRERLPASVVAAAAWRPIRIKLHMAELAGHSFVSANQPPVRKNPCSNALRDVDDDKIVRAIALAEPHLGQRACIRDVIHL